MTVFSALAIRQLFGVAVFALVLAILASGPAVGTASALAASRSPSSTVARRTTPTTTGALGGDWSLFVYGVMMVNTRHATEGSVANWSARPHTDAKETIVRKHAKLWGVILGRQLKKIRNRGTLRGPYEIHYVDAFAGPGEYDNGVLGSPVRALQGLVDAASVDADGPDIFFWAVERNPDTVSSLDEAVARHTIEHPRVRVRTLNLSFRDAWDQYQQRWGKNTFLLLDGFGWLDEAVARHTIEHPRVRVRTLNLSFRDAWDQYQQRWGKNTFLLLDGFGWQASVPEIFRCHMVLTQRFGL